MIYVAVITLKMSVVIRSIDNDTSDVSDVKTVDLDIKSKMQNVFDVTMILLTAKTGQDFMKISKYFDTMPQFQDTILFGETALIRKKYKSIHNIFEFDEAFLLSDDNSYSRTALIVKIMKERGIEISPYICAYFPPDIIGCKLHVNYNITLIETKLRYSTLDKLYTYHIDHMGLLVVGQLIRNLKMTFKITQPDVKIEFMVSNMMPVTDDFIQENYTFTAVTKEWILVQEHPTNELVIKSAYQLDFPIIVNFEYDEITGCPQSIYEAIESITSKNRVTKVDGYWQNIRLNGDTPWKSEMCKLIR